MPAARFIARAAPLTAQGAGQVYQRTVPAGAADHAWAQATVLRRMAVRTRRGAAAKKC
jgi:hypothetical protein